MDARTAERLSSAYGLDERLLANARQARDKINRAWNKVQSVAEYNQAKVLEAFHYARVSEACFAPSTGYGYGDLGRERLEEVFARIFGAEAALVRTQFVSGTHAIACALFACAGDRRPLICATGRPYDTLMPVIGSAELPGTIAGDGSPVEVLDLDSGGAIDVEKLVKAVKERDTVVFIQRSCGYQWRPSIDMNHIARAIDAVRQESPGSRVIVDNCYGEFVEDMEPCEVGADLIAGSLIKNPGGGLCPTGGYIAGRRALVERAGERLASPGIGSHVGSNPAGYRQLFQGVFMAPGIVGEAVKGAVFAASFFEGLGFEVSPHFAAPRTDIIQGIKLGSRERLEAFCRGIQRASAVDAFARPTAAPVPGYTDGIIMAGGTFVQGSSIELSADGPLREPYAVFLQGGLSAGHAVIGAVIAAHEMVKEGLLPSIEEDRLVLPGGGVLLDTRERNGKD